MKKALLAAVLGLAWSVPAQAQDTHEKLIEEVIPQLEKFGKILADVKDKASAETAMPKLKEVGKKMVEFREKAEKLGKYPDDKKAEIEKKYKPKLDAAGMKLRDEMVRIATQVEGGPEIAKEIAAILVTFSKGKK